MKILVTGAGGYVGIRITAKLIEEGHQVIALVRSKERFHPPKNSGKHLTIIEGDLGRADLLPSLSEPLDGAYFLIHAMAQNIEDFAQLEDLYVRNFLVMLQKCEVKQIIYLSGIANEANLSKHLSSRAHVEDVIRESQIPYTILQAGIIIGAASASFEIIRDLVEKLPVMIAPKWVRNRCQAIAIYDVIFYLTAVLGNQLCLNQTFEIAGPELCAYKEILLTFARLRGLKRWIINVPVLTPRLSSLWLYFVTSTNFFLARALVGSLRNEIVRKDFQIDVIIPHQCQTLEEAFLRTLQLVEQNEIVSGWKDAFSASGFTKNLSKYLEIPQKGCLKIFAEKPLYVSRDQVIARLWSIGGKQGWMFMDWAWRIRGFIDQLVGGVGLRRGRTHPTQLRYGDALDFWRVLVADRKGGRLVLFAEMKLPGEAWLEFHVEEKRLVTRATFRPKGVLGRLYWWSLFPIHWVIFHGMTRKIVQAAVLVHR